MGRKENTEWQSRTRMKSKMKANVNGSLASSNWNFLSPYLAHLESTNVKLRDFKIEMSIFFKLTFKNI